MTDKWSKTHPWRAVLWFAVPWDKNDPTKGELSSGERMQRTKGAIQNWVDHIRTEYGERAVSDVYKVGDRKEALFSAVMALPIGEREKTVENWRSLNAEKQ